MSTTNLNSDAFISTLNTNEINGGDVPEQNESKNLLCIIVRHGKLGAAYYNFSDRILYFYDEMIDPPPQYLVTQTLLREVAPKYVVTFGCKTDEFVRRLMLFCTDDGNTTVTTDEMLKLPQNFHLLPLKEYSYEICKLIIMCMDLPTNPHENQIKREMYIQSLINFNCRLSVQCLGALIKYLEKNWAYFETDKEQLQFLHIHQKTLRNHVLMDATSFDALHIFHKRGHESSFKRGSQSASREGFSLYQLYLVNCKSVLGQVCLRNVLLNPIHDLQELNVRMDFIEYSLLASNREFVEALQDNIKHIHEVNTLLIRVQNGRASSHDWKVLYKSIYHLVFLSEICGPHSEKSTVINDFFNSVTPELLGLEQSISTALDFNTEESGRPTIKYGVDESLDEKKLRRNDISKSVNVAARIVVDELPDYIGECTVIYLPEMGHLIAIKEWQDDCDPNVLQQMGYQFVFKLSKTLHYKNPICRELDKCFGDINSEIIDHENRIIRRLSGYIIKYLNHIRVPIKKVAMIDCLLAMARVAGEKNFVRPQLNSDNTHEITGGRHPLMELMIANFERNDFRSGGPHGRVKIITGPNGSGKSIYLKQVGVILYMAHVGSYVPAQSANIGLTHSIHCRIQATESASVRLSAFMIDISQTTKALETAKGSSLILMDEFGRGTTINEGVALLVGVLKAFISRNLDCPHILVSTHFQQVIHHLPESDVVEYWKTEHTKQDGCLYFLYKIVKGVSDSYAFDIATELGFDQDIIQRARYIFNCLKRNERIVPINMNKSLVNLTEEDANEFLFNLDIPEPDD